MKRATMICEGCNKREAIGMTGNGECFCRVCLQDTYRYALLHVPEGLDGMTESQYVAECIDWLKRALRRRRAS